MNKYSPLLFVMAFSFLFGDANVQIRLQNGQIVQGEFVGTYMNHVHILVEEKIIYYACDDITSITYSAILRFDYDCSINTVTADILFPPQLDPMTGEMTQMLPDVFNPDIPKPAAKVEDGLKLINKTPKQMKEEMGIKVEAGGVSTEPHPKVNSEEKLPASKLPYTWSMGMSFGFQSEKTPVSFFNMYYLFRLNEHQEIFTGVGTIMFGGGLFTGYKHYLNDFSKPSPYMSISYHGGAYYDTGAELTGIFPSLGFSQPISKNSFLNFGIGYVFMQKNTMNDFRGKKGFVAPFLNYEMLK